MIETKHGDLLTAKGVIVHGVNSRGVMGSGVAKQIKAKWKLAFTAYKSFCEIYTEHCSGSPLGLIAYARPESDVIVANMFTQDGYGRNPSIRYVIYEAVRKGFNTLNKDLLELKHYSPETCLTVNFPLIGCGLANGDWDIVSSIIDEELDGSLTKVLWLPPVEVTGTHREWLNRSN